jgi:hypothetical protein
MNETVALQRLLRFFRHYVRTFLAWGFAHRRVLRRSDAAVWRQLPPEGRGPACCLPVAMDDSSGRIFMRFVESEDASTQK